jgi:MFS family permease
LTAVKPPSTRLWRRNLNRLWLAQSASLLGMQVGSVAVPLVAVDALHANASQVALIATLSNLPGLFLTPIVGSVADRTSRKAMLVVAHLGRSALWLTVPVAYVLGALTLPQLWLVALLVGVLGIVFEVAYRAFLPGVVPREVLGSANGKMAATDSIARASGPALAGYLIQWITAPWTLVVQVVSSLLAGIATMTIRFQTSQPANRDDRSNLMSRWVSDVRAGFACLYRIRPLRWLTAAETLYLLFFSMGFAVLVVFLRTTLDISPGLIGVIFSAGSIAGLLGASAVGRLRRLYGLDRVIRASAVLRGVGLAALPLSLLVPASAVIPVLIMARALNAFAWTSYEVVANTYEQSTLPDRTRGSATAAGLWLGRGAEAIGAGMAAALASGVGVTPLLITAGIGATLSGLVTLEAARIGHGRRGGRLSQR